MSFYETFRHNIQNGNLIAKIVVKILKIDKINYLINNYYLNTYNNNYIMIYKVSNQISDIKNLLTSLKDKYDDYAFISYVHGEYGIRVWVYNSLCYDFYKKCKQNS